jgi:hypothetical protein
MLRQVAKTHHTMPHRHPRLGTSARAVGSALTGWALWSALALGAWGCAASAPSGPPVVRLDVQPKPRLPLPLSLTRLTPTLLWVQTRASDIFLSLTRGEETLPPVYFNRLGRWRRLRETREAVLTLAESSTHLPTACDASMRRSDCVRYLARSHHMAYCADHHTVHVIDLRDPWRAPVKTFPTSRCDADVFGVGLDETARGVIVTHLRDAAAGEAAGEAPMRALSEVALPGGHTLWEHTIPAQARVEVLAHVIALITANEGVYAFTFLSADDGALLAEATLSAPPEARDHHPAYTASDEDNVYFYKTFYDRQGEHYDARLFAVGWRSGEVIAVEMGARLASKAEQGFGLCPSAGGGPLTVFNGDRVLYAVDPARGEHLGSLSFLQSLGWREHTPPMVLRYPGQPDTLCAPTPLSSPDSAQGALLLVTPLDSARVAAVVEGEVSLVEQSAEVDPSTDCATYQTRAIAPLRDHPVIIAGHAVMTDDEGRFSVAVDGVGEYPIIVPGLTLCDDDPRCTSTAGDPLTSDTVATLNPARDPTPLRVQVFRELHTDCE